MTRTRTEIATELGSALNALLAASRTVIAASAARFHPDIQPAAYQLAIMLDGQGAVKAGRLAKRLGMDKSAVSRLARTLCDHELAQACPAPEDGRATLYSLTKEGRERLNAANKIKSDAFFSRLAEWSDAELTMLVGLLKKFNQS